MSRILFSMGILVFSFLSACSSTNSIADKNSEASVSLTAREPSSRGLKLNCSCTSRKKCDVFQRMIIDNISTESLRIDVGDAEFEVSESIDYRLNKRTSGNGFRSFTPLRKEMSQFNGATPHLSVQDDVFDGAGVVKLISEDTILNFRCEKY